MEKMKEKINKFLDNGRGAILAIFILELILTFFVTPNKFDDEYFLEQVTNNSCLSFVMSRYSWWSSRVIIEFILCAVLKTSKYLWILLEAIMVTIIGYSISKIFVKDNKKENNIMLLFMILLYPLNVMNGAGWAATTTNYMWPLATCLFALVPISEIWKKNKIAFWKYPLYTLALIYAGNQEQTCAILVGTYILFSIFMIIRDKKIHPYMIIQTLIIIASLIFILTCPGNYLRNESEIQDNFKDFEMLTVLDKIGLGLTATNALLVGNGNIIFIMLTGLIIIYIFSNYKEKLYRIIAVIPFLSVMLLAVIPNITSNLFSFLVSFKKYFIMDGVMLTAANSNNLFYTLPVIFAFVNFLCVILSILIIFKNLKNNIALLVFLVGLASRLIMGFSPTIFASASRTMIFFEFSMIIVSILVWQELIKKTDKNDIKIQNRTSALIKCAGILQYLNVLLCIFLTQK